MTSANKKPIEEKESNRWLEGYRKLCDLSEQLPGTMLVSISDREGDIYECFVEAACGGGRRAEYIIRGCQDRSLPKKLEDGCYKKLMEEVSEKPVLGEVEFKLPKHVLMKWGAENRPSGIVIQSVRAGRVRLKPPYRKDERLPEVEINTVLVEEINPPDGEEPITWLLLTSLPVDTFEQACLVVEYYLCRWQIEIYFKVLKSGCKIEDRQFETSERIKPCIALYMIVALRLGLVDTCPTGALALMAQQHEVVHVIYCQSRSTLTDTNENRDWRIYADFAQVLIHMARDLYLNDEFGIELSQTVCFYLLQNVRKLW